MGEEEGVDLDFFSGYNRQRLQMVLASLVDEGQSEECRIEAAKEMRRLTKSSARTRAFLGAGGAIPPLVSMLSSLNPLAQDSALLALLNLAVKNERNKVRIVKAGAMPYLVEFLQSENSNLRESAAASILTLSASSHNRVTIGESEADCRHNNHTQAIPGIHLCSLLLCRYIDLSIGIPTMVPRMQKGHFAISGSNLMDLGEPSALFND